MTKVHGKRYAYKFDFHALMQSCQTQGPEVAAYKYPTDFSGLFSSNSYGYSKLSSMLSPSSHMSSSLHQQSSLFPPPPPYWSVPSPNSMVPSMNNLSNLYSSHKELSSSNFYSKDLYSSPSTTTSSASLVSSLPSLSSPLSHRDSLPMTRDVPVSPVTSVSLSMNTRQHYPYLQPHNNS